MPRTAKLDRREMIFVAAGAVFIAGGAGIYALLSKYQEQQRQAQIAESMATVQPGETYSLSKDGVPWNGTLEITLERSTWYDSYADASRMEDLGAVTKYADDADGPYIVCEFTLHSVDAIATFNEEGQLNISFLSLLLADGTTTVLAESVKSTAPTVEGDTTGMYVIEFEEGDTASLLLGYPLPEDSDRDGLCISITGSNVHFALGLSSTD